jgi:hypothetical protein
MVICFTSLFSQAQIIDFPDPAFKEYLLNCFSCIDSNGDGNYDGIVDTNNDGEITELEALQILRLTINDYGITSLEGIEYFISLENLHVDIGWGSIFSEINDIDHIDLSSNINLEELSIDSKESWNPDTGEIMTNHPTVGLNSINLANCTKLKSINLS